MKITNILAFCKPVLIGGAAIGFVGGCAIARLNTLQQQAAPEITEEPIVEEAKAETPAEEPTEQQVGIAEGDIPARGEVGAEEVPAIKPSTTTKPSAPTTQETIVYSILGHKKLHKKEGWTNLFDDDGVQYTPEGAFTNINDFEKAAIGLCPEQIPAGAWPQRAKPGIALGIIGSPETANTPMAWTDWIWNTMKQDPLAYNVGQSFVRTANMGLEVIGEDGVDRLALDFTIDWPNRTIDWKRTYESSEYKGKDGVGSNATNYMNNLTAQMTARLRQRDSEFKAKCGY